MRHLVHPDHTRIVLWDNNLLGSPDWRALVEELSGLGLDIDVNQGLDPRLVTAEVVATLRPVKLRALRLAYDHRGLREVVKRAVTLFQNGKKRVKGLHLQATDLDWELGNGEDVTGPAEALLMAMVDARQISAEELARVAEKLAAAEREAAGGPGGETGV